MLVNEFLVLEHSSVLEHSTLNRHKNVAQTVQMPRAQGRKALTKRDEPGAGGPELLAPSLGAPRKENNVSPYPRAASPRRSLT